MQGRRSSRSVIAALVSAELHRAMGVAKEISLTAGNARALALRAGQQAAGFRAITDFIDELAQTTVRASRSIDALAGQLSRTAAARDTEQDALDRLEDGRERASAAVHADSVDAVLARTRAQRDALRQAYDRQLQRLRSELDDIARELRAAVVLSAMSRVEASRTAPEHGEQLRSIAARVAGAAERIREHVRRSQASFGRVADDESP